MLRGPLHDRGPDGRCTACGEPFPCPPGLRIYNSVVPRAEGRYHVRFITDARSMSVEPRLLTIARANDLWTLIWRPARDPLGDRCYEHFDNVGKSHAEIGAHADANRHPGTWWTSYDVDGAAIFSDCQVEVIDGPL